MDGWMNAVHPGFMSEQTEEETVNSPFHPLTKTLIHTATEIEPPTSLLVGDLL